MDHTQPLPTSPDHHRICAKTNATSKILHTALAALEQAGHGTFPPMWLRTVLGGLFVAAMESMSRQEVADVGDEAELIFVDV